MASLEAWIITQTIVGILGTIAIIWAVKHKPKAGENTGDKDGTGDM